MRGEIPLGFPQGLLSVRPLWLRRKSGSQPCSTTTMNIRLSIVIKNYDFGAIKNLLACTISSVAHRRPPDPPWSEAKAKSQTSKWKFTKLNDNGTKQQDLTDLADTVCITDRQENSTKLRLTISIREFSGHSRDSLATARVCMLYVCCMYAAVYTVLCIQNTQYTQ